MIPTPYPYQSAAITAARQLVLAGKRRVLLVSPTGSGKSTIGAWIAKGAVHRGKRVAWFAHRTELRDQAAATLERCELDVGHSGCGAGKPVQVVSTQGSLSREECPEADLVVLDECHHYAGTEQWSRIPEAYPNATIIGLTATPERADGRGMGNVFEALHVVAQPRQLVGGALVDCEMLRPPAVQRAGYLARSPVDAYKSRARGRTVVFAPNVAQATEFAQDFRKAGIACALVYGGVSAEDRAASLAAFAEGTVKVLVNVFVLTEGWDCPSIETVILARKVGSCGAYMQMTGRGLRASRGKSSMLLLDLAGVSHLHGSPLDDRIFSLDGVGMMLASQGGPRFCRACGELLDEEGPCSRCGRSRRASVSSPKYSQDPLEKFAHMQRDNDLVRAERLAKWIRQAREHGKDWRTSLYRYKGTYGASPPKGIVGAALTLASGPVEQ
jgi:superfamily II DNA or RNA helicase